MPREKGSGEGSIRERPDGLFEFRIMDGYKADGKPYVKSFFGKTAPEARKKYKKWLENKKETRIEKIKTIEEWAPVWLESYKHGKVQEGTYQNYRLYTEKHIIPYFGKTRINNIRPAMVESFMSTKTGLSFSARHQIWLTLKMMLDAAVENKLCVKNPCKEDKRPTEDKEQKVITWPRASMGELLKYLPAVKWGYIAELLLYSGLREGELAGLRWSDIDNEAGMMHITQNIGKTNHGIAPKSTKGGRNRKIGITQELKDVLDRTPRNGKYVLADTLTGNLTTHQVVYRYHQAIKYVNAIVVANGGEPMEYLSPHKCRHTYATYLARGGASAKDVQKILGHASLATTQIYFDVDSEDIKTASQKLVY